MKTSDRLRHSLLFAALAVTVAAAGWVGSGEETAPALQPAARASVPRSPATPAAHAETGAVDVKKLHQRLMSREFGELFASSSWQPPSPPPAKPEPPRAPPLPFTFFGRMVEDGKTVVFLARKDQTFAVKTGEIVGGSYRVEDIGPSTVVLMYLPLKELQTLNIGEIQ